MYVGPQDGKAMDAVQFYTSLFEGSRILADERFQAGEETPPDSPRRITFTLAGQEFMAFDGGRFHEFTFSPALSLFVSCETQAEVDTLWDRLTDGGKEVQCGWLEDRYGVSWQIFPTILGKLLQDPDAEKADRVMQAMLKMKKLDLAALQQAYETSNL
jgi:predicted 3-demethylubiquinone-9 3-methyltransferase (glyoxalase superfamily)